jgi:hypothetical protein
VSAAATQAAAGGMPEHGAPTLPPLCAAVLEKALLAAERRAVHTLLAHPACSIGKEQWPHGVLADHRLEVFGDLSDALDALLPGTGAGWRLMRIAYPEVCMHDTEGTWDVSDSRNLSALLELLGDTDPPEPAEPAEPTEPTEAHETSAARGADAAA